MSTDTVKSYIIHYYVLPDLTDDAETAKINRLWGRFTE